MVGYAGAFPMHTPRRPLLLYWARSLPEARWEPFTDMDVTHVELDTGQTTYTSA